MNVLSRVTRSVTTLFVVIAIFAGIPWLLVRFVGNPLPSKVPTLDDLRWIVETGQVSNDFWIGLLAIALWFVWLQLVVSILVELATLEKQTPKLPGFGFSQGIAGQLVARSVLIFSILGSNTAVAGASSLSPLSNIPASIVEPEARNVGSVQTAVPESTIKVEPRDTFRSLAQKHLGSSEDWKVLRDINIGRVMPDGSTIDPNTIILKADWELAIPLEVNANTETESFTVESGDHFWNLAKTNLERSWGRTPTEAEVRSYWLQLVEANNAHLAPPNDPNLIFPGQEFDAPAIPSDPTVSTPTQPTPVPVPPTEAPPPPTETEPSKPVPGPPMKTEPLKPVAPTETEPVTPATAPDSTGGDIRVSADAVSRPVLFASLGGLVLALLTITIVRRRKKWATQREAGKQLVLDPNVVEVEEQIRSLSTDGEDASYVAALVPWLSTVLRSTDPLPEIVGVRAGDLGVEILLDEPCDMPSQFIATSDGGRAHRLDSEITDRKMKTDGKHAHPYMPLLLPVGNTPSGELLIDFEQLSVATLNGAEEVKESYLKTLLTAALSVPWTENVSIVAIGLGSLSEIEDSRLHVPVDPKHWAKNESEKISIQAFQNDVSTYRLRVDGDSDWTNTLVLVGSEFAGIAQHLRHTAELADGTLTLISASELPVDAQIMLTDSTGSLESTGLMWDLDLAGPEDLASIDQVLNNSDEPPQQISVKQPARPEPKFVPMKTVTGAAKVNKVITQEVPVVSVEQTDDPATKSAGKPASNGSAVEPPLPPDTSRDRKVVNPPTIGGATLSGFPSEDISVSDETDAPVDSSVIDLAVEEPDSGPDRFVAAESTSVSSAIKRIPTKDSAVTEESVAAILEPKGVEVRVLRESPDTSCPSLTPKQIAVVSYIALQKSVTRQRLREEFWSPDQPRAADNTLSKIRKALGTTEAGNQRFPRAKDTYEFDDVDTDWAKFVRLAELADTSSTTGDKKCALDAALDLVEGQPAIGSPSTHWSWLTEDPRWYLEIERLIVDVAAKRAAIAIEEVNPLEARHAIRRATRAVPSSEELTRWSMRSSSLLSDNGAIDADYRAALEAAEQLGIDLTPATELLYNQLCGNVDIPKASSRV